MIDPQKLIAECDFHIKRGDGMAMAPEMVKNFALLVQAAHDTLEENLHLADGKNCTLRSLRDAYLKINPTWNNKTES